MLSEHVPAPSQLSARSQLVFVGSPQTVPGGAKFTTHSPVALQISAKLHRSVAKSPQAIPARKLGWHCPLASQLSEALHSLEAESPQEVSTATWFGWQSPTPSQVSGLEHSVCAVSPQVSPATPKLGWQVPWPSQLSAALQTLLSVFPHGVSIGELTSTQRDSWHSNAWQSLGLTQSRRGSTHRGVVLPASCSDSLLLLSKPQALRISTALSTSGRKLKAKKYCKGDSEFMVRQHASFLPL